MRGRLGGQNPDVALLHPGYALEIPWRFPAAAAAMAAGYLP
jgi:hypothetical protein